MHLVAQIAHFIEDFLGFVVVGDGFCLTFLAEQGHAQLVEGNAERVAVVHLAENGNGLPKGGFRLGIVVLAYQDGGQLGAAHGQLVEVAPLLLYLTRPLGVWQGPLVVTHLVIDLRGRTLQDGHAGGVVHLLCQFDGLEYILFGLLGLVGSDVDARQRVERGGHDVGVARLFIEFVAQFGIVRCLVVVGQTKIGQ